MPSNQAKLEKRIAEMEAWIKRATAWIRYLDEHLDELERFGRICENCGERMTFRKNRPGESMMAEIRRLEDMLRWARAASPNAVDGPRG